MGDTALIITNRSQSVIRWIILFLVCIMMFGDYYCYDNPAALKTQIGDHMGNPSNYETMFSLLYTLYSLPNVVLPFFSGYFIDTFGASLCLIAFCVLVETGQIIFAIGLSAKSWPVMFLGRTVYGFGGASLSVGTSALLSYWFSGNELAFAFGINVAFARLGSVVNNVASPALADSDGVVFTVWVGSFLLACTLGSAVAVRLIDTRFDAFLKNQMYAPLLQNSESLAVEDSKPNEFKNVVRSSDDGGKDGVDGLDGEEPVISVNARTASAEAKKDKPKLTSALKFPRMFWVMALLVVLVYGCILPFNNILSTLLLERDYFKEPPSSCQLQDPSQCENPASNPTEGCPSSQWYQPPLPDYVVVGDIDCTKDSWQDDCATSEYCDRLTDGELQAATVMSIPYILSTCLIPFVGAFVGVAGLRGVLILIVPVILIIVHVLLAETDVSPVGPLVGQGIAYSLFAAVLWPSVPLIIEEKLIGLAYGICFSIQNIGLSCLPLIIAAIYIDSGSHYIPNVEYFIVLLALLALVGSLYLNFLDYFYYDSVLNKRHVKKPEEESGRDQPAVSVDAPASRTNSNCRNISVDRLGQ